MHQNQWNNYYEINISSKIGAKISEIITMRLIYQLKYILQSKNNNTAVNKIITMKLIYQLKYVLKSMNNNHTINK